MTKPTAIIATFAAIGLAVTAAHAAPRKQSKPSECRGLEQPACTANPVCKWQPARKAGETLTARGTPAKTSAKAHCRVGRKQKES